jgi:hypothetical protein
MVHPAARLSPGSRIGRRIAFFYNIPAPTSIGYDGGGLHQTASVNLTRCQTFECKSMALRMRYT